MGSFLEEYGKVIVAIVLIAAMVLLIVSLSDSGKKSATNGFGLFNFTAEDSAEEAAESAADAVDSSLTTESTIVNP